ALLYDYRCPHCRMTHDFMLQALERYPGQIALSLLPTPLSNKCNPYFSPDFEEPRFVDSCELAQTALAVWHAAPEQFPALDAWMFQPESPRTADEAKAHAERLIGADALDAAIRSGYPAAQIRRNADLFHE